jgi:energy-converting hydrogenase A subunit M
MDVDYNSAYRNKVLAQMFEALVIDIGEYIPEPSVQAQDFSSQIEIHPGIARE